MVMPISPNAIWWQDGIHDFPLLIDYPVMSDTPHQTRAARPFTVKGLFKKGYLIDTSSHNR